MMEAMDNALLSSHGSSQNWLNSRTVNTAAAGIFTYPGCCPSLYLIYGASHSLSFIPIPSLSAF